MTAPGKPYAYGTKADVGKSRQEIERVLAKNGAAQIMMAWDQRRNGCVVFVAIEPQLAAAYETGVMPRLLPEG